MQSSGISIGLECAASGITRHVRGHVSISSNSVAPVPSSAGATSFRLTASPARNSRCAGFGPEDDGMSFARTASLEPVHSSTCGSALSVSHEKSDLGMSLAALFAGFMGGRRGSSWLCCFVADDWTDLCGCAFEAGDDEATCSSPVGGVDAELAPQPIPFLQRTLGTHISRSQSDF